MTHVYLTKEQKLIRSLARSNLPIHPALLTPRTEQRPSRFDLKEKCPFVYDQGTIGSCTANAACMALVMLEPDHKFTPSRLWLYYKERLCELQPGQTITDSGANAEDGLNILVNQGVCSESDWPYLVQNCNIAPPVICDNQAKEHRVVQIGKVAEDNIPGSELIDAIAKSIQMYIPVLIAIEVYESFEGPGPATTGCVPLPNPYEQYLGGHEVLIIGYDDNEQKVICINSWGPDWGYKGFFNLPYDYITNPYLTSEFICISRV